MPPDGVEPDALVWRPDANRREWIGRSRNPTHWSIFASLIEERRARGTDCETPHAGGHRQRHRLSAQPTVMLTLFFAAVSLLYATVGQAGGTAFLALMAFASFPASEMRPTALLLNIVAASYSTWLFNRGNHIDWIKLRPLLAASLPTAFTGGFLVLAAHVYDVVTGLALLAAAGILFAGRSESSAQDRMTPFWGAIATGAGVGFVSGLTGVGGGVFLAPILIAMNWASPKQTAALSAPFILANSAVGLSGALYAGQSPSDQTWLYALAACAGAMIGTTIGLRWLSQTTTRYLLAAILAAAGVQLLVFTTR